MIKFLIPFLITTAFYASAATAADKPSTEFEQEVSSLTNPARAYSLRLKSLEELVEAYPDKAYSVILPLFKDPKENLSLRYQAARGLWEINQKKTERVFLEILDNPKEDPASRRIALVELVKGRLRFASPPPALALRARTGTAAGPPGKPGAPSAVEKNSPAVRQKILGILFDKKEDPALRQYALGVFGSWKEEPNRIERLQEFVQSKSETLSVRTNALFLLESSGDPDFVYSSVLHFLEDRHEPEELRKNCVIIAGRLLASRLSDETLTSSLNRIAKDSHESSALRQLALAVITQRRDGA